MPANPPAPTTLARVRASRNRKRYQAALDVVELYQRYIARLDRSAIRDAIEHHALIASRDDVLLELQCAFDTIRAIAQLGWTTTPTGLLQPPHILGAHKEHRLLDLYYQHTPAALGSGSLYREIQTAHSFPSYWWAHSRSCLTPSVRGCHAMATHRSQGRAKTRRG